MQQIEISPFMLHVRATEHNVLFTTTSNANKNNFPVFLGMINVIPNPGQSTWESDPKGIVYGTEWGHPQEKNKHKR